MSGFDINGVPNINPLNYTLNQGGGQTPQPNQQQQPPGNSQMPSNALPVPTPRLSAQRGLQNRYNTLIPTNAKNVYVHVNEQKNKGDAVEINVNTGLNYKSLVKRGELMMGLVQKLSKDGGECVASMYSNLNKFKF